MGAAVAQVREQAMVVSGRGGFRKETRTTRLERLHGPKPARKQAPKLSPQEQEKLRQQAVAERERYRRERASAEDRR
jgi:hypothetical protein